MLTSAEEEIKSINPTARCTCGARSYLSSWATCEAEMLVREPTR